MHGIYDKSKDRTLLIEMHINKEMPVFQQYSKRLQNLLMEGKVEGTRKIGYPGMERCRIGQR